MLVDFWAIFKAIRGTTWSVSPGPYTQARWYGKVMLPLLKAFALLRTIFCVIAAALASGDFMLGPDLSAVIGLAAILVFFGALDWIPYRKYVWYREPNLMRQWSVPFFTGLGLVLSIALLGKAASAPVFEYDFLPSSGKGTVAVAALNFVCSLITTAACNVTLWYYIYRKPASLSFTHYGPRCSKTSIATSTTVVDTDGPCARLFAQQSQAPACSYSIKRKAVPNATGVNTLAVASTQANNNPPATSSETTSATGAHYHPSHNYWAGHAYKFLILYMWPFFLLYSFVHLVIQAVRVSRCKGSEDTPCENGYALHIIYPLLWPIQIAVMCFCIHKRVDFTKHLWGPFNISALVVLSWIFIIVLWFADLGVSAEGSPLFETWQQLNDWGTFNGLVIALWMVVLGGILLLSGNDLQRMKKYRRLLGERKYNETYG